MNVLFFLSTEIFLKGSFLWLFLKSALKISPLIPALKKRYKKVGRSRTFLFLSSNRSLSLSLSLFFSLSRSRSSPRFASSRLVVFRNPAGDKTSRHDRAGIDRFF